MIEPIFPLELVSYPGETVNLHIFEPRYRQMMQECHDDESSFVIAPFMDGKIMPYGTRMILSQIVNIYDDGKMDVTVKGLKKVRLRDVVNPVEGKLYAGAVTEVVDDDGISDAFKNDQIHALVLRFQELIKADKTIIVGRTFKVYDLAQKIGLSAEQKYELLTTHSEKARQDYVIHHLQHIIPMIKQIEDAKARIQMNGHFPSFGGKSLDF